MYTTHIKGCNKQQQTWGRGEWTKAGVKGPLQDRSDADDGHDNGHDEDAGADEDNDDADEALMMMMMMMSWW